jgi:hypothetical protein
MEWNEGFGGWEPAAPQVDVFYTNMGGTGFTLNALE